MRRMLRDRVLEELWRSAPAAGAVFHPPQVADRPPSAQRYLLHALAPGAPLSIAARLSMHGTIRLSGAWHPFSLPVTGYDRWVDGEGALRWRLLGLVPVMTAAGPDVTRSAAGRLNIESVWLPAALLAEDVRWTERDDGRPEALVRAHGEERHRAQQAPHRLVFRERPFRARRRVLPGHGRRGRVAMKARRRHRDPRGGPRRASSRCRHGAIPMRSMSARTC